MHLIVGMPAYTNSVKMNTFNSLFFDLLKLATNGWTIEIINTISGAEIDTIRNKFVSYLASHEKADELLMVDDDVCWHRDDVLRLLAADIDTTRDIIGGLYPKRSEFIEYPFDPLKDDQGGMRVDPNNGLIECRHMPAGFMRVPKGTAKHLIEEHPELQYDAVFSDMEPQGYPVYSLFEKIWEHNEVTGMKQRSSEDVSFCKRVTAAGGSIYCHPDIAMGHVGHKCFKGVAPRGNSPEYNHESTS